LAISAKGISSSRRRRSSGELQGCFVFVEVPGEHQRHGDLHDFRGLDAGDAERQPAFGAVDLDAEQKDEDEQEDAADVERNGKAHQLLRRHLRDEPHDDRGDRHVAGLAQQAVAAVVGGAELTVARPTP
jgi:hypothetical protein